MNKSQFKRVRKLLAKVWRQSLSEGLTQDETQAVILKILGGQGVTVEQYHEAEQKYKQDVEDDTGDESFFFMMGPRGFLGPVGPQGPQGERGAWGFKGDKGDKGDRGDKGDTVINEVDVMTLKQEIETVNARHSDFGKDVKDRFEEINKYVEAGYVKTSVLEPSVKSIVHPELNRILRSFSGTVYALTKKVDSIAAADGTVTSVSVVSANGFAGTVATATTTPAITISTSITGILLGDGTAVTGLSSSGTGNVVRVTSATLVTPTLGVASATSLATSAAIPLLLTNGQLVNISLTAQTVGATTLTIPDFASVVDTFAFVTLAQTLSNKTFVAPALGTPASGVMTNVTGIPAAAILAGSFGAGAYVISTSLQAATIELGHATDTTISRTGAGAIAVEGVAVLLSGGALGTPLSGTATNITGLPLTTGVTGILPSANGGTAMAFFTVAGPATTAKTFTFPNADSTVLTTNAAVTVAQGGTGVATVTDGGLLIGKGTAAFENTGVLAKGSIIVGDGVTNPVVLAVGTNSQVLTADSAEASGLKWAAAGGGTQYYIFSTVFETAGRFDVTVSGGTSTFNNFGWTGATTATANRYASILLDTGFSGSGRGSLGGSPLFTASGYLSVAGTDCKTHFGVGAIVVSGLTIDYIYDQFGFKMNRASSVSTTSATNGDGTTETATSFAHTVTTQSLFAAYKNGTTNITFYVNNSLKATHTTNLPDATGSANMINAAITNINVASNSELTLGAFTYQTPAQS